MMDTQGEAIKTMKPPEVSAPDPEEHKRMHIAYCNAHDKDSPMCERLLKSPKERTRRKGKEL